MKNKIHKPRVPFLYNEGEVVKGCLILKQIITTYYSEAKKENVWTRNTYVDV